MMRILVNGSPLDDVSNFVDHFHTNTIFQQIHQAPFGSGGDFLVECGLVLTIATACYLLVPNDRPRLKTLINIGTYLALGLVTLLVFYDQMLSVWAVMQTW